MKAASAISSSLAAWRCDSAPLRRAANHLSHLMMRVPCLMRASRRWNHMISNKNRAQYTPDCSGIPPEFGSIPRWIARRQGKEFKRSKAAPRAAAASVLVWWMNGQNCLVHLSPSRLTAELCSGVRRSEGNLPLMEDGDFISTVRPAMRAGGLAALLPRYASHPTTTTGRTAAARVRPPDHSPAARRPMPAPARRQAAPVQDRAASQFDGASRQSPDAGRDGSGEGTIRFVCVGSPLQPAPDRLGSGWSRRAGKGRRERTPRRWRRR